MADVEISYNGNTIVSMSDSGTEYLDTKGMFMTDNVTINYTKSGGGGAMLVPLTLHPSGMMLVSSKTAQEIMDAYSSGQPIIFAYDDDKLYFSLIKILKYNSGCKIFTVKADDTTTLVSQTVNTMSANPTFSYQSL